MVMQRAGWVALAGVIVMSGCATWSPTGLSKGAVQVVAHRGASAYAPENTLTSFSRAADLGADWFELDCTLTRDDALLIVHDDTVDRTTNGKGAVALMTLAELKQLDAGAWKDPQFAGERLPTLDEALDLAKARHIGVYIEIKRNGDDRTLIERIIRLGDGKPTLTAPMRREMMRLIRESGTPNLELTERVLATVRKKRMARHVVVQSFSPIVCAIALCEAPRIRTEMLALKDKDDPQRWPMFVRWLDLVNPAGFNTNPDSFDPELLTKLHSRGQTMAMWTLDDEDDIRRHVTCGVDRVITNKPDVCLKVLKDLGRR